MIKKLIIILIFLYVSFAKTGQITFEASGKADISGYTFNDNITARCELAKDKNFFFDLLKERKEELNNNIKKNR